MEFNYGIFRHTLFIPCKYIKGKIKPKKKKINIDYYDSKK